ncbi:MAG: protein translocase subunit SecF [Candidatus Coatesbacteria bacterium]|nr:protein translocase subunit SecF [Candidatus Coatesbacteria bacterium]
MQIFTESKFDFIKGRKVAFIISAIVILAGVVSVFLSGGFNLGIDFTGGVRVQVKFADPVTLGDLTEFRTRTGMDVYTIGSAEDEVVIRQKAEDSAERLARAIVEYREEQGPIEDWEELGEIEDFPVELIPYFAETFDLELNLLEVRLDDQNRLVINEAGVEELTSDIETLIEVSTNEQITAVLTDLRPPDNYAEDRLDLNGPVSAADYRRELSRLFSVETAAVEPAVTAAPEAESAADEVVVEDLEDVEDIDETVEGEPAPPAFITELADELAAARNLTGVETMRLLDSMDEALELAREAGLDEERLQVLRDETYVGAFQLQSTNVIGPKVGEELGSAALTSILVALVLILGYISVRFEFSFAIGAIIALAHDVLVTLGIFALLGKEINLSIIAALLTLVGYSLNDTIVVFDRVREDRKLLRRRGLREIINTAINETLSRTVLTSGTTLIVTMVLVLFGGSVIHDFALALTIGVLVGTYSSIFIASPFLLAWYRWRQKKA